uniref:Putative animal heme peroxidase n=1 Tax=Amblyomma cajennense TaxID=34607 RepID=A0A023FD43_AMBCJ
MFCRLLIACCLWVVVSESYGMYPSRKYAHPLSLEASIAIDEKMKYVMPRSDDGVTDAPSCPFLQREMKLLKKEKEKREEAIKEAFQEIKGLIESSERCDNATEVRDEVLAKLNASLSCAPTPECNESYPYRAIDGSCNNVNHPDWGKRDSCLRRVLSPSYADGISEPRRSCKNSTLPSPRLISTVLHYEKNITNDNMTHLAMIFGQFLTHDITFVSFAPLSHIEFELGPGPFHLCSEGEPECVPIKVPENDSFYANYSIKELPILRSLHCNKCEREPRDQVNSRTSYLDLSQVYGIKGDIQASIIKFEKGLLISQEVDGTEYPPDSLFPYADNCSRPQKNEKCAWTGDLRATQHIALLSMQTLWLREHNRIAKNLSDLNPHWDDEKLFQTTRRIVEGRYQNIVFKQWLPWMLGNEYMQRFNLTPSTDSYTVYDPDLDATVSNEFSAAAFRFGHSQADKNFWREDKNGSWLEPVELSTGYFVPYNNTDEHHDSVLRGSLKQPMQKFDRHGDEAVRNHLFRQPYLPYGSDLFATDIQRGRDHGLRPYVDYIKHCHNKTSEQLHRPERIPGGQRHRTSSDGVRRRQRHRLVHGRPF